MTAERAIHASIFFLLLVGLCVLSLYTIFKYLPPKDNLILVIASIPLSWGVILLVMYIGFRKLGWNWWS